ncbi:hypothetical protein [Vulcanisaeta souniana]|uniref:hypothetical protein n=1 Tax=Vulcanisaeta souniana TaxID=164452 RepID=UPI000AB644AC|nr:hypothetical protein [Vulcanisaeta souniana]
MNINTHASLTPMMNLAILGVVATILGLGIFNINFLLHPTGQLTVTEILVVSLFLGMLHA